MHANFSSTTTGALICAAALSCLAFVSCTRCKGVLCSPCAPPINVVVHDADNGLAVDGLRIEGEEGSCEQAADGSATFCTLRAHQDPGPAGPYSFSLVAIGYSPRSFTLELAQDEGGACCGCGYISQTITTTLQRQP